MKNLSNRPSTRNSNYKLLAIQNARRIAFDHEECSHVSGCQACTTAAVAVRLHGPWTACMSHLGATTGSTCRYVCSIISSINRLLQKGGQLATTRTCCSRSSGLATTMGVIMTCDTTGIEQISRMIGGKSRSTLNGGCQIPTISRTKASRPNNVVVVMMMIAHGTVDKGYVGSLCYGRRRMPQMRAWNFTSGWWRFWRGLLTCGSIFTLVQVIGQSKNRLCFWGCLLSRRLNPPNRFLSTYATVFHFRLDRFGNGNDQFRFCCCLWLGKLWFASVTLCGALLKGGDLIHQKGPIFFLFLLHWHAGTACAVEGRFKIPNVGWLGCWGYQKIKRATVQASRRETPGCLAGWSRCKRGRKLLLWCCQSSRQRSLELHGDATRIGVEGTKQKFDLILTLREGADWRPASLQRRR